MALLALPVVVVRLDVDGGDARCGDWAHFFLLVPLPGTAGARGHAERTLALHSLVGVPAAHLDGGLLCVPLLAESRCRRRTDHADSVVGVRLWQIALSELRVLSVALADVRLLRDRPQGGLDGRLSLAHDLEGRPPHVHLYLLVELDGLLCLL